MINNPDFGSFMHLCNRILFFKGNSIFWGRYCFPAFFFILSCMCHVSTCIYMYVHAQWLAMAQLWSLPLDSEAFPFSVLQTLLHWNFVQFFFFPIFSSGIEMTFCSHHWNLQPTHRAGLLPQQGEMKNRMDACCLAEGWDRRWRRYFSRKSSSLFPHREWARLNGSTDSIHSTGDQLDHAAKSQELPKLNIVEGVYCRHLLALPAKCLEMTVAMYSIILTRTDLYSIKEIRRNMSNFACF